MSNTIAQNLAAIKNIKDNLRIQINAKGVSLSASAPFSSYPAAVAAISGGGGEVPEDYVRDYANRVISETARESVFGTDDVVRVVPSEYKCSNFVLNSNLTQIGGFLFNSNYSTSSNEYIESNSVFPLSTADSWEFQTVYTYSDGNSSEGILGFTGSGAADAPVLSILYGDSIFFGVSSDGNSWDISGDSVGYNFTPNTTYYIKAGFTGSAYYCSINASGWSSPFETLIEIISATKCYCSQSSVLMNSGEDTSQWYNTGVMDLSQTKWIINGSDYLVCGTLTTSTL